MISLLRGRSAGPAKVTPELGSAFLNATPDAVFLIKDGAISECNDATIKLYGYSKDKIIGSGPDIFSPSRQRCGTLSSELAEKYIQDAITIGYRRFTWTNQHSDGRMLPLLVTLAMTKIDGVPAVVVTAQDHTDTDAMIQDISSALTALAAGNLTQRINREFQSEYELIRTDLNDASEAMHRVISSLSTTTIGVRLASDEIAQASEDLARRTEGNAAALEETFASITQMDCRLRASVIAATQTVERADQAIATVGGGRAVADEAVQAMGRVSDSAKGIDSVIEGLDKIAFQTRVLAMNAAVEAGRAGDAGRGFAVVADLVSALAMRAEEEAKRARDQLTMTQTDIVTAVNAVTKVDGALLMISDDVFQVHELLGTMALDNQAQSSAITQISAAIGAMDHATQQNAAMVEETSAAARNLAGEVAGLAEQSNKFQIKSGRESHPAWREKQKVGSRVFVRQ